MNLQNHIKHTENNSIFIAGELKLIFIHTNYNNNNNKKKASGRQRANSGDERDVSLMNSNKKSLECEAQKCLHFIKKHIRQQSVE